MKNKNLKKWALVAEIVGGAAIVLSLIFVGFQIRQEAEQTRLNTRAVEASAYQDLIGQMNAMYLALFTDSDNMSLVITAYSDEEIEDPVVLQRARMFIGYVLKHSEMSHLQYEKGLISEQQLYNVLGPLNSILQTELGKEEWRVFRIRTEFRDYVSSNVLSVSP